MNDDLISRKALLEKAKDYFISPDGALRLIESQPTAYDADEVIGQLKDIKTDNSCRNCTYKEKCDELQEFYNPDDSVDLCVLTIKELAIEIVKSGGVAND